MFGPMAAGVWRHIALLALVARPVQSFYFLVPEGEDKCFIQALAQHEVLKVTFAMSDKDPEAAVKAFEDAQATDKSADSSLNCKVVMTDAAGNIVKTVESGRRPQPPYKFEGVFAVAAAEEGVHTVCMQCVKPSSGVFDSLTKGLLGGLEMKWKIDFDVMKELIFDKLPVHPGASLKKVETATEKVEELLERFGALDDDNEFEKTWEARWTRKSKTVNLHVMGLRLLQGLLIACVATWQVYHLSLFLHNNTIFDRRCLPTSMPQICRPTI